MNNHGLNDPETQVCQHWDTEHSPRGRGRQWCSFIRKSNAKKQIKTKLKHRQPSDSGINDNISLTARRTFQYWPR